MAADPVATQALFHGIPDVVWSGIVAAGMTLIGTLGAVIATNWGNTKRLRLQLEHDTTEKVKERLATLRRELYLKSADASVRGLGYFGALPQADLTKPDSDAPLRNVLALGAQLQLVVKQETAHLISDLISAYGELHLRLIAKVMPMHKVRANINICNEHYENTQVEIKRVLAAMAELNESGQRDPVRFAQLNQSFDFATGRAEELADERAAFWDRFNALQREYMKYLIPELKRLAELQTHLMVELRRELDVGGDIATFKKVMEAQMQRAEQALTEFDRDMFGADSPQPVLAMSEE